MKESDFKFLLKLQKKTTKNVKEAEAFRDQIEQKLISDACGFKVGGVYSIRSDEVKVTSIKFRFDADGEPTFDLTGLKLRADGTIGKRETWFGADPEELER